jgi:hypothetical protein
MDTVPVDSERWRFQAAEHAVEDHLGRRSLRLRTGIATVADADIRDRVIELELAFGDARGFMGPVWRVRDAGNLEWFFLRPHQSGNPDATQYTPAFNGSVGWQLYHGDRYTVTLAYRFDEWLPLRVAFRDERAEIFVGDLEAPALVVDDLKRVPEPGSVGASLGDAATPHWRGLCSTRTVRGPSGSTSASATVFASTSTDASSTRGTIATGAGTIASSAASATSTPSTCR